MKKRLAPVSIAAAMLVIASLSCTVPGIALPVSTTEAPLPVDTLVFQTYQALTAQVTPGAPTLTYTPTQTYAYTLPPPANAPRVSVSLETNCRTGPGKVYPAIAILFPGETAVMSGRAPDGEYWIISNPDGPGTCWLWGTYATVVGDTSRLPIIEVPPTPTPTATQTPIPANYTVQYSGLVFCTPQYAFNFMIVNTGSVTWQSVRIKVTDQTNATWSLHTGDTFKSYDGCILEDEVADLMPGESSPVTTVNFGQIDYNPTGHSMLAEVMLCTQDGLAGQCVNRTLQFVP